MNKNPMSWKPHHIEYHKDNSTLERSVMPCYNTLWLRHSLVKTHFHFHYITNIVPFPYMNMSLGTAEGGYV